MQSLKITSNGIDAGTKLMLGNVELDNVRSVKIEMCAGRPTLATIELYVTELEVDGNISDAHAFRLSQVTFVKGEA